VPAPAFSHITGRTATQIIIKLDELPKLGGGDLRVERLVLLVRRMRELNQKEIDMRELTLNEVSLVSGAGGECSSGGNTYGGVADTGSLGQDLINIYEGLVSFTSYVIERVAKSL